MSEQSNVGDDRKKVEMETTCPACGSTDVYGVYGGDAPAKVECRNCGHYGGSWE